MVVCQPHRLHPQVQLCISRECIPEHISKTQVWISWTTKTYTQAAFKIQLWPTEPGECKGLVAECANRCQAASARSSLEVKPVCGLKDSALYVHFNVHFWCPKHCCLIKMGCCAIQKASFAAQSHFSQLSHQWRGWKVFTFFSSHSWQLMAVLTFTWSKFCPLEHLCHSNAFHTVAWL